MIDEKALNIYVDGSSYSHPRVGGIGIRFVTINADGDEVEEDVPMPGYQGGSNNQMELQACIVALKEAQRHRALWFFERILLFTDSRYVVDNYRRAMFEWPRRSWRTREGAPVLNAPQWKQLVREISRCQQSRRRVDIQWVKGHSKDKHNRAVDKLAKVSARQAVNPPLSVVSVRRKRGTRFVEVGSVAMKGQRLAVRIVTVERLPVHKLWKYKYEVLSKRSRYASCVDLIYSDHHLRDGHHYEVRVNKIQGDPRIVAVLRELDR